MWRFIPTETYSAFMNMALDEACLNHLHEGLVAPTIRFYRWQPSSISIGYFQNMKREIDTDKCQSLGVDMIRRQTGGGAVYHDYHGELTYSVIAPLEFFSKNIIESYQEICGWIVNGLQNLGIDAQFVPINDIVTNGKKISGNAQTRRKGVLLQHGTILLNVDAKKMFNLLLVPDEKIRDKMIQVVEERVTSLYHQKSDLQIDAIQNAFFKSFLNGKKYKESAWSPSELDMAKNLVKEKYQTKDWNFMR